MAEINISMDGRGQYLDNIFIGQLWRSLEQQALYLHEINDGFPATRIIDIRVEFNNSKHPQTALDKQTLNNAYFVEPRIRTAA